MKWRVLLELTKADGSVGRKEVVAVRNVIGNACRETVRLTLAEGKSILADLIAAAVPAAGPSAPLMPDRCTPEHDRLLARMASLAAYGHVAALMAEFVPLNKAPAIETARRLAESEVYLLLHRRMTAK